MSKKPEESGILRVGICWMVAGSLAMILGLYLSAVTVCNCPNIPLNATQVYATSVCQCHGNGPGFLYVGAVSLCAGLGIAFFRKNIAKKIRDFK